MHPKFTRLTGTVGNVEGLIQIQRLGKIRLGLKKANPQGKEYPSETEHFVCPPEVAQVFGESPTVLEAMFPSNDPNEIYQEKLALYGSTQGLKCHGNGKEAERRDEQTGEWKAMACPCKELKSDENPRGQCSPQAHLKVILPKVSMWGYYQITTRSIYARGGILAALQQMQSTLGRIAGIPIKLVRLPKDITPKGGKKKTHHILSFVPDLNIQQIMDLRNQPELTALPAYTVAPAIDEDGSADPVDVVEDDGIDAEALANMDQNKIDDLNQQLKAQRTGQIQSATPKAQPTTKPIQTSIPSNGTQMIQPDEWANVLLTIDEHPTLGPLKAEWKRQHSVDDVRKLNMAGQHSLLTFLREQCKLSGIKCPV